LGHSQSASCQIDLGSTVRTIVRSVDVIATCAGFLFYVDKLRVGVAFAVLINHNVELASVRPV